MRLNNRKKKRDTVTRYSPLATPSATRAFLKQWGLQTNKSLGQHFLIDDGVVGRILRLAEVQPGDRLLEVGPGIGTLTRALLAQGATVCALEKDQNLFEPLTQSFIDESRFTLIATDALDIETVLAVLPLDVSDLEQPLKLVANLPYGIAATLVLSYFESFPALAHATVMVQREVAERMMAEPGTKDYGAYTVKLRMLVEVQGSFVVSASNFMPPPRVDSMVIRLDRRAASLADSYASTSFVVEAAFAQRRKTIRNAMRAYFLQHDRDPAEVDTLLEQAGIDPRLRGETLSLEQFIVLGNNFKLIQAGPRASF